MAFIVPQKVASTSILEAIRIRIGEEKKWGKRYLSTPENVRDVRTIGFVRHPLDRLVSCYHNQCLGENRYNLGECSFLEFANFVLKNEVLDKHFVPQFKFLGDYCDQIIKFEELDKEWSDLMNTYGLPELQNLNTSKRDDWRKYYNPEITKALQTYYKRDFDKYGYEIE